MLNLEQLSNLVTNLHEVHETIEYSMSFMPFNDYISKLYAMRLKAKKNKSSEQIIYKLFDELTLWKIWREDAQSYF